MKVFALTGGIACGKTTVSLYWQSKGLHIVDADVASKKAVEVGTKAYNEIVECFGDDVLNVDNTLNRTKLGKIVFSDSTRRSMLESIVHPAVKSIVRLELSSLEKQGIKIACYDCPLLFETGLNVDYDTIVVVKSHPAVQLSRLMERNKLSEDEAQARIDSQLNNSLKENLADYVIDNTGSIEQLRFQCDVVLSTLLKRFL